MLNAVASMDQLAKIRTEMKQVTAFSDFTPGNRYADVNSATDKSAEYGIAALVAGGVAAKLGLFGKLFALLFAFKNFVILGLGALVYGLIKFSAATNRPPRSTWRSKRRVCAAGQPGAGPAVALRRQRCFHQQRCVLVSCINPYNRCCHSPRTIIGDDP